PPLHGLWDLLMRQRPFIRRRRIMITLNHLGAFPALLGQFERWLEEVHIEPCRRIEAGHHTGSHGIDAVHQRAQPPFARDSMMERREPAKKAEMVLAPADDIVEVVARRDRGAGQQKQDLGQRIGLLAIPSGYGTWVRRWVR